MPKESCNSQPVAIRPGNRAPDLHEQLGKPTLLAGGRLLSPVTSRRPNSSFCIHRPKWPGLNSSYRPSNLCPCFQFRTKGKGNDIPRPDPMGTCQLGSQPPPGHRQSLPFFPRQTSPSLPALRLCRNTGAAGCSLSRGAQNKQPSLPHLADLHLCLYHHPQNSQSHE